MEGAYFKTIFPAFVELAQSLTLDKDFKSRVGRSYNTSVPKTVDNANHWIHG